MWLIDLARVMNPYTSRISSYVQPFSVGTFCITTQMARMEDACRKIVEAAPMMKLARYSSNAFKRWLRNRR